MGRPPRPQHEIANREAQILGVARISLSKHGFQGFTMSDLANDLPWAKGTLYLHFDSKEDMLLSMVCQNLERRITILNHAATCDGMGRERLMAPALAEQVFRIEHPDHHTWEALVRQPSFWNKTSEKRRTHYLTLTQTFIDQVEIFVTTAMANGHLPLPRSRAPEITLMFCVLFTAHAPDWESITPQSLTIDSRPPQAIEVTLNVLLDGLGVRPLSNGFDWNRRRANMASRLFPILLEQNTNDASARAS